MKYYIYFDGYGNFIKAITEEELKDLYKGDIELFIKDMSDAKLKKSRFQTGHVAVGEFNNLQELQEFLDTLGDEVEGFFCCNSDSRPYNF